MDYQEIVTKVAQRYGDLILKKATNNFANTVFIGEKNIYKIIDSPKKIANGEHEKEKKILELLHNSLPKEQMLLVPEFVHGEHLEEGVYLQVQKRLAGASARVLTPSVVKRLVVFLRYLHSVQVESDLIDEFESAKPPAFNFVEYVSISLQKYLDKIKGLGGGHADILDKVSVFFEGLNMDKFSSAALTIVHKDLSFENLLVDETGVLTGVIDWETCQTAPREWEFAILKQRFPDYFDDLVKYYGEGLDTQLIQVCGLTQSLRFWKSYPNDEPFVASQVAFIEELLES